MKLLKINGRSSLVQAAVLASKSRLVWPGVNATSSRMNALKVTPQNCMARMRWSIISTAKSKVETILPGALAPALPEDFGPSGHFYAAQDYKMMEF